MHLKILPFLIHQELQINHVNNLMKYIVYIIMIACETVHFTYCMLLSEHQEFSNEVKILFQN